MPLWKMFPKKIKIGEITMKKTSTIILFCVGLMLTLNISVVAQTQYKVLATKKTSTMQKELQEAADAVFALKALRAVRQLLAEAKFW